MIDKEAPILAFDVSKGSSHCQGYLSFGEPGIAGLDSWRLHWAKVAS